MFLKVKRCNGNTNENWTELINLDEIVGIEEHRIGEELQWNNRPGRRRGYKVLLKGGFKMWITDREREIIIDFLKKNENTKIIEY